MARDENPPFVRGAGYWDFDYTPSAQEIIDTAYMEGKEWVFEDIDWSDPGAKAQRTGRQVRCRVVRNTSVANLVGKRLVSFEVDQVNGTDLVGRVDGYADATDERSYPTDEFLPPAGIQPNNLFFIVMEGPAIIMTGLTSVAIAVGASVGALTGSSSANSSGSAGRITSTTGTRLGYALSALTSGNTNSELLVDVTKF